nr:MAG TPA: hypothetical protein [Caudoviricetes sp.]
MIYIQRPVHYFRKVCEWVFGYIEKNTNLVLKSVFSII